MMAYDSLQTAHGELQAEKDKYVSLYVRSGLSLKPHLHLNPFNFARSTMTGVRDFASGILKLDDSHCVMCTFTKAPQPPLIFISAPAAILGVETVDSVTDVFVVIYLHIPLGMERRAGQR